MTREEAIKWFRESPFYHKNHEPFNMAIKALEQEPCEDVISRQSTLKPYEGLKDDDVIAVWLIRKNIEQQPSVNLQEPKWIPVSERLPEENKSVLVYAPEYNNIYCAYLEGDTWFIFGSYGTYAVANVIAWMPLPKPYEPQENEEISEHNMKMWEDIFKAKSEDKE